MTTHQAWPRLRFVLSAIALYFVLQAVVVILHEHAHSTAAWLLGDSPTPFTVIWGNPITLLGWDEGVPYDQLFPPGHRHPAEAIIGGIPLLMHALFTIAAVLLLERPFASRHRLWFFTLYCFLVVNLTELVAYILMRPFAGSGDTGRFNRGLGLSPWFLFLGGTLFLLAAFWILHRRILPRLDHLLGPDPWRRTTTLVLTAFIMFLWGSGLRVMLLYPDRQWRFGLIGLVACPLWILAGSHRLVRHPA